MSEMHPVHHLSLPERIHPHGRAQPGAEQRSKTADQFCVPVDTGMLCRPDGAAAVSTGTAWRGNTPDGGKWP